MRIVHLFKDFDPPVSAGITRYLRDVADATAHLGHEVHVHVAGARTSRREILPSGVTVHRHAELGRALSSPLSPGLALAAATEQADVLHVHSPNPVVELGAAFRRPTPTVVSFHAQLGRQAGLEPIYGPVQRRLLARSSAVLVSSPAMADAPELVTVRPKVRVLPYGVSPRVMPDVLAAHVPSGDLRLLFVGRLVYYKGVEVLLDALGRCPGATLTVVGDGPLRVALEARAAALGIAERVRFLGHVNDDTLRHQYPQHDVFVMPSVSRAESFGMAMSEAMAHGLPALSTSLETGTDWVNLDDVSGVVVTPSDVDALAHALARLEDPELRSRLAAGARDRVEELFSFDRHHEALLGTYEEAAR